MPADTLKYTEDVEEKALLSLAQEVRDGVTEEVTFERCVQDVYMLSMFMEARVTAA